MCGVCPRVLWHPWVSSCSGSLPAFSLSAVLLCNLLAGCLTVTMWQPQLRTLHLHTATVKGEQQGELGLFLSRNVKGGDASRLFLSK